MATTGTYSNYASQFQFPSGTVYPCVVVDFPELTEEALDVTNNQSGGVDEYIYSGLVRSGEFTLNILGRPGSINIFKGYQTNKTSGLCVLTTPMDTLLFTGLITSVKPEAADQQNPDAAKFSITVQPSGGISVA